MLAKLILLLLVSVLIAACGTSASPTPTPTDTPVPIPISPLASEYDVEESHYFTMKQLGEEYVKSAGSQGAAITLGRYTPPTYKPIFTMGCHTGESISYKGRLWVAFSPDGTLDIINNVVLVTGFDPIPHSKNCYEMVIRHADVIRLDFMRTIDGERRSHVLTMQGFRLVDGKAIRTQQ